MYKRVFVVTDIHSCFTELSELLNYVNFGDKDRLIINGDLLDRGGSTGEIIEFLMNNIESIVYIRGNHEELLNLYVKDGELSWITSGGISTLDYFTKEPIISIDHFSELLDTITVDYHIHNRWVITHNWLKYDNTVTWDRSYPVSILRSKLYDKNYNIVTGHTMLDTIINKPMLDIINQKDYVVENSEGYKFVNLDFGCYRTRVLGMLELNSGDIFIYNNGYIIEDRI